MSYAFDIHDYVKICQAGYNFGDIAYVADRFQLPDPHPCNMYICILINASADEITIPEDYLVELDTDLKDLEDLLNRNPNANRQCECGADKLGFGHHYSWCPKHRR